MEKCCAFLRDVGLRLGEHRSGPTKDSGGKGEGGPAGLRLRGQNPGFTPLRAGYVRGLGPCGGSALKKTPRFCID